MRLCLCLGRFEEARQPPGYSQVSAAGMALPDAPSWCHESVKPAPAASVTATLPVPENMSSMPATFTMQQQHPRAGSATPSLSSCSTVRAGSKSSLNWKVSLVSEWLVGFATLFCLCLARHGSLKVSNWAVCVGITGVDAWKDHTVNHIFVRTHLRLCFSLCCYVLSSVPCACPFLSPPCLICMLLFFHSILLYICMWISLGD